METERKENLKICVYYLFILRNPFHIVSLRGMQRGIKLGQFSIEVLAYEHAFSFGNV
jgi:hypothetical protein